MAGVHALIGIGEGLITIGALTFLLSARPDLILGEHTKRTGSRLVWLAGLILAVALVILAPLASTRPDGLEWVAMQAGFIDQAQASFYQIVPDYLLPGVANEALATIASGVLGILIIMGVGLGVAYTRRKG